MTVEVILGVTLGVTVGVTIVPLSPILDGFQNGQPYPRTCQRQPFAPHSLPDPAEAEIAFTAEVGDKATQAYPQSGSQGKIVTALCSF